MRQQPIIAALPAAAEPGLSPATLTTITKWFTGLLAGANCRIERIPLSQSKEWSLQEGFLTHRSKGFFTVAGLRWTSPDGDTIERPFIVQREVGTLGFLMRRRDDGHQLLVQAKIEPGNVGLVQLAPTCQATRSNTERLHGGAAPPFIDDFVPAAPGALYDVNQSEQGTRFVGKRNRNVLALTASDAPPPPTHRWLDADRVLALLWQDYLVNTDARSVLVCAPWEALVNRVPFSRYDGGFGAELLESSHAGSRHVALNEVKGRIRRMRMAVDDAKIVSLGDLPHWRWTDRALTSQAGPFALRQIRTTVNGREVPKWDQPIVDSNSPGAVVLVAGRIGGVVHFLFRPHAEAGLREKVELAPTVVIEPGESFDEWSEPCRHGRVIVECRESEEGGRFYRDTNVYRIIDAGDADEPDARGVWLTLADIRRLLDEAGWFTNESRSALSLLLPWM